MTSTTTTSYPFAKRIDSGVEYADGIWFSSGPWAIRISRDKKNTIMPCAKFKTPAYWEPLPDNFLDRMDACTYPPTMAIIVGFWIFHGTHCLRVPEMRGQIAEGPGEIKDLWPATKGTLYADKLASCVQLDATVDTVTYLLLTHDDSPKNQETAIYIRHRRKEDHQIGETQKLYKRYPRLEGHTGSHSRMQDRPVTSILKFDDGLWFFFDTDTPIGGEREPEGHVFKYSDLDHTQDLGPGAIRHYFPALGAAKCQ